MVLIVLYDQLYINQLCHAGTTIAQLIPKQTLHVLVVNFNIHKIDLHSRQVIAYITPHHGAMEEPNITKGEMLVLISEDFDNKFRKRHVDERSIETINKHLDYQQEQHIGADKKPVTADDIDLNTPH